MSSELTIRTLSADVVRSNLNDLIAVAADVPGEYWAAENFLVELPQKWRLSFALWQGPAVIGYAILSQKAVGHIHLHHLMVLKQYRNHGLGERMVREILSRCRAAHAGTVTLKTQKGNCGAIRFYKRYDFRETAAKGEYVVMSKSLNYPKSRA